MGEILCVYDSVPEELKKRLVAELSRMQPCVNGGVDQAELSQGKDVIQLEVKLFTTHTCYMVKHSL